MSSNSGSNFDWTCSNIDWKGYALGELDGNARSQAEAHAATCTACREELAATRLTLDALSTLREEEVPRRIAFVSDKVFEPRWWQSLFSPRSWNSTVAAACVVAAAILVHGFVGFARPSASPADIQAQVNQAVTKAVADSEQRQAQQLQDVLNYVAKQNQQIYKSAFFRQ
jgi:anti-sigma-K factor RskA